MPKVERDEHLFFEKLGWLNANELSKYMCKFLPHTKMERIKLLRKLSTWDAEKFWTRADKM